MVYENKMKELNQLLINRGIMIRHTKSLLYDRKLLDPIHVENIILDTPIGYRNELEKLYSSGGGFSVGQLQKLRVWLAVAKVKFVIEHTENIMENYKDKVIIFGNYKAPLKILADHFNTISHDGDIKNPTERQELIDNFMIHKTQNVLIMSIATGGVGLNLTEANHVVLNDYPYSPSQLDQAISRAHRLGQKQQVTVHYLTAKNTIDEDVVKILTNKSNISSAIIDGTNYPFDKDGIERTIAEKVEKMIRSQKSKKTKTPKFHQKK
jgi:SNF2 family DNA or RNA helicase